MFWKKKTAPFRVLNPGETSEKRQAFRYRFREGKGVSMTFSGRQAMLLDLSAGGLSFENHGFSVGGRGMASFDLFIPCMKFYEHVSVPLVITRIDGNGICYAYFENPDPDITELIHRFLLERQKADLRSAREEKDPDL